MSMPNSNYNRLSMNGSFNMQNNSLLYDRYDISTPPASTTSGFAEHRLSDSGFGSVQTSGSNPANHAVLPTHPQLNNSNGLQECTSNGSGAEKQNQSNLSVTKIGHDILKMIEEQKKLVLNQKNELERLDSDIEQMESKDPELSDLISKIDEEIMQLEELSKENEIQINKLESLDLEKELQRLKSEQTQIESDIEQQKNKLSKFEDDIASCTVKIRLALQTEPFVDDLTNCEEGKVEE